MVLDPTKTFETLECWKACRELRVFVRDEVTSNFLTSENLELKSQIVQAGRSATANIAEGYGRYHFLENRKFCFNARGSLYELLDHLITAHEECYIDDIALRRGRTKILDAVKILNGYIAWMNTQHSKSA